MAEQITTRDLAARRDNAPPHVPRMGHEPHPADDAYAPPVATVKLPSRGLIYPMESPLYLCESVDVRGMTAREEDILASPNLIRKGTVLSTLMRACITNRLIDPDQMLGGDRNAILVAIRVSAYGQAYEVEITCPECAESAPWSFDLSRLPLKMLDEQPSGGPGTNEFEFVLPSGRRARFRLLTASDAGRLEAELDRARKAIGAAGGGAEQGVTMRLLAQVTSLEGVGDPKDLPRAITSMQARDSRALRVHMDKMAPGVDMRQSFECPHCGRDTEVDVPIGTEFFWPSGR